MMRTRQTPRVLIYFLYRLFGLLATPLIVLYLLWRGLRDRRYWKGLGERFGQAPVSLATIPGGIWLHAVSVGEVISAVELLRQLRREFPTRSLHVSVTTVAGREIAEQRLKGITDGIFYAPIDLCWVVRRVLRRLKPQLVIVMETEIWPNLYRESKRFGAGLLIVNGRISDRAMPSYRKWRWAFLPVLQWPDRILAQNEQAAGRYRELGAAEERVEVAGNLKYDFEPREIAPPAVVAELIARAAPSAVWIAASTMPPFAEEDPDEDDSVIRAFGEISRTNPRLLLALVPRRPERFELAAKKLEAAGVTFLRRSGLRGGESLELPGVLLVDTMGELSSLFPLADVVFMGGTLAQRGGHNILEPAFCGKPVIIGPHMENFPDIGEEFRRGQAVEEISGKGELGEAVRRLLASPERGELGAKARRLAEAKRGTTARALRAAVDLFQHSLPIRGRPPLMRAALWPLAKLWEAGLNFDRWRKLRHQKRLSTPVISIGGVTMGGTGKTPLVGWLAERLGERGFPTAVLTRGYRRTSPERNTILPRGAACCTARTGDEAQILLRTGKTAMGIGADRYISGRLLEEQEKPAVFLLDDGFQHWKLARDVELVAVDALDPLGGGSVVPLGRLREPLSGLSRASAFLITRSDGPTPWFALEDVLRRYQPDAPIFYSHIVPMAWVDAKTGETFPPDGLPVGDVAAFCGLGNPVAFWKTLADLGIHPKFQWNFDDHHAYRSWEVRRLFLHAKFSGARALLTTEKDFVNLPPGQIHLTEGRRIFWLRMRVEVTDGERMLDWLQSRIQR